MMLYNPERPLLQGLTRACTLGDQIPSRCRHPRVTSPTDDLNELNHAERPAQDSDRDAR